jgi:hypothetical protein
MQYFYSFYAEQLASAKVSFRFSRTSLLLATAIFFAISFESRHLVAATRESALTLLADFDGEKGEARFVRGIRALCACAALSPRRPILFSSVRWR